MKSSPSIDSNDSVALDMSEPDTQPNDEARPRPDDCHAIPDPTDSKSQILIPTSRTPPKAPESNRADLPTDEEQRTDPSDPNFSESVCVIVRGPRSEPSLLAFPEGNPHFRFDRKETSPELNDGLLGPSVCCLLL
jgi:hypothetical protein